MHITMLLQNQSLSKKLCVKYYACSKEIMGYHLDFFFIMSMCIRISTSFYCANQLVMLFWLIIGTPRVIKIYNMSFEMSFFFQDDNEHTNYSIDKPWKIFETASHIFRVSPHYYVISYINMKFFFFMSTRMFVESCKRLRIMKGKEAIGLGQYLNFSYVLKLFLVLFTSKRKPYLLAMIPCITNPSIKSYDDH